MSEEKQKKNTRSEQSRINGRSSKGPKTTEGKERSSQNAVKHGLTSKTFVLMEDEVLEEYEAIRDSFMELYNPQNPHEVCTVHLIAQMEWKCLRCGRLEDEAREALSGRWSEGLKRAITVDGFEAKLQSYGRQLSNLRLNIKRAEQDLERRQTKRAGSERGLGVSPAKDQSAEPQSLRAKEPQHQITKRTQEKAEDSPSPFPGRERQACPRAKRRRVRDGFTDHVSEITKSERSGDPGELSESGRTQEEDTTEPSRLAPHASRLDSPEPPSPRAQEPHQQITKRTQATPEPSLTDPEKRSLCLRARAFLTADRRFHTIGDVRLAWGIRGLALCLAYAASGEEARWHWVVVGDLPPAHLPTGPFPTAEEALKEYAEELRAWLEAAKAGEPSNELLPMLHPVTFHRLKVTPEAMNLIENRACFIDDQVLQTYGEELRSIGLQGQRKC